MISFADFSHTYDLLDEAKTDRAGYPLWVKTLVVWFGLQTASLEQQIANEEDPRKRDQLLARQNRLLAYMTGLGIAVDTRDKALMGRIRSQARR
jgi:hypothetical protein